MIKSEDQPDDAMFAILMQLSSKKWFDITILDRCLSLTGISAPVEIYKRWQAVHCTNYEDMSRDFRRWLGESIINTFKIQSCLPPSENGIEIGF